MIVTTAIFERGKSRNGGWSRLQLESLGVTFPLKSGWRRRLVGTDVPPEAVARFMELKDGHLKDEPLPQSESKKPRPVRLTRSGPQGIVVRAHNTPLPETSMNWFARYRAAADTLAQAAPTMDRKALQDTVATLADGVRALATGMEQLMAAAEATLDEKDGPYAHIVRASLRTAIEKIKAGE